MSMRKQKGNMYPWVTHTHSHLGGECPYRCQYCYVKSSRFGTPERYRGPLRMIEDEFLVNYGDGKIIFIDNCTDLFAGDVPLAWIIRVLLHCRKHPDNMYVFQTKNPSRYLQIDGVLTNVYPPNVLLGATIETNRDVNALSQAPHPEVRMRAMEKMRLRPTFVTIEPCLDFDVDIMVDWMQRIQPRFINIGADSKRHNLPEPNKAKIKAFIRMMDTSRITVKTKDNLKRLLG